MSLIARDKYLEVPDGGYVSVSANAESEARLAAAYALVAEAANCGGNAVLFQQPLTQDEIDGLAQNGITATENKNCVYPGRQWFLRWGS